MLKGLFEPGGLSLESRNVILGILRDGTVTAAQGDDVGGEVNDSDDTRGQLDPRHGGRRDGQNVHVVMLKSWSSYSTGKSRRQSAVRGSSRQGCLPMFRCGESASYCGEGLVLSEN